MSKFSLKYQPDPMIRLDDEAQTGNFTAENGKLYKVTPTGTLNVQLPPPTQNLHFAVKDLSGDLTTNSIVLVRNGTENIDGNAANYIMDVDNQSLTLYSDGVDWFILTNTSAGGGGGGATQDDKSIVLDSDLVINQLAQPNYVNIPLYQDYSGATDYYIEAQQIFNVPTAATQITGNLVVTYDLPTDPSLLSGNLEVYLYGVKTDPSYIETTGFDVEVRDNNVGGFLGSVAANTLTQGVNQTVSIPMAAVDLSNEPWSGTDLRGKRAIIAIMPPYGASEEITVSAGLVLKTVDLTANNPEGLSIYADQYVKAPSYAQRKDEAGYNFAGYDAAFQWSFTVATSDTGKLVIDDGAITETKIDKDTIKARHIQNGAINNSKLADNAVDGTKIQLKYNTYLRGTDSAGISAPILRLDTNDDLRFATLPKDATVPTDNEQLVNKLYVDDSITNADHATRTLNNLTGTAVNANINPGTDNTPGLGTDAKRWKKLYLSAGASGGLEIRNGAFPSGDNDKLQIFKSTNTPSGASYYHIKATASTQGTGMCTENITLAGGAANTGHIRLESGTAQAGTSGDIKITTGSAIFTGGKSGNVEITTGTSLDSTRGDIILDTSVDRAKLATQPTGADQLAIATTKYVDDNAGGGATTLDALTDTTITSPADTQVLTYSGGQWVNAAAPGGGGGSAPAGMVDTWAGDTPATPAGYLDCDGSVFSSTAYPDLAAAIGNKFSVITEGADLIEGSNNQANLGGDITNPEIGNHLAATPDGKYIVAAENVQGPTSVAFHVYEYALDGTKQARNGTATTSFSRNDYSIIANTGSVDISDDGNTIVYGYWPDGRLVIYKWNGSDYAESQVINTFGNQYGLAVKLSADGLTLATSSENHLGIAVYYDTVGDGTGFTINQTTTPPGSPFGGEYGRSLDMTPDASMVVVGAPDNVNGTPGNGNIYIYRNTGAAGTAGQATFVEDVPARIPLDGTILTSLSQGAQRAGDYETVAISDDGSTMAIVPHLANIIWVVNVGNGTASTLITFATGVIPGYGPGNRLIVKMQGDASILYAGCPDTTAGDVRSIFFNGTGLVGTGWPTQFSGIGGADNYGNSIVAHNNGYVAAAPGDAISGGPSNDGSATYWIYAPQTPNIADLATGIKYVIKT